MSNKMSLDKLKDHIKIKHNKIGNIQIFPEREIKRNMCVNNTAVLPAAEQNKPRHDKMYTVRGADGGVNTKKIDMKASHLLFDSPLMWTQAPQQGQPVPSASCKAAKKKTKRGRGDTLEGNLGTGGEARDPLIGDLLRTNISSSCRGTRRTDYRPHLRISVAAVESAAESTTDRTPTTDRTVPSNIYSSRRGGRRTDHPPNADYRPHRTFALP